MKSIFENAYFSKPYRTREGKKVLYVGTTHHLIEEENFAAGEYSENGIYKLGVHKFPAKDIISEWEE